MILKIRQIQHTQKVENYISRNIQNNLNYMNICHVKFINKIAILFIDF